MKKDFAILLLWPIAAALLSFAFSANTLVSTLFFFGIPALYLSFRNPHCIRMAGIFALLFGIPAVIVLDYVMEITQGWYIPHSVLDPYRIFGQVSVEQLIWIFLYIYFVAMFYEMFLDKTCTHRLYWPKLKYLILATYFLFGLFVIIHLTRHELLNINYFYLKFGIILGLIPIAAALWKHSSLYAPLFKTGAYFFYLSFIYEVTALTLGQWTFPAANQFIGFITIAGTQFPLEELLFWILLGSMAVISYYRLFGER